MSVPPRAVYRVFQTATASYLALLVVAMYLHTMDPTGDIKALITAWAAALLGGGWIFASWRYQIPLYRPQIFSIVLLLFLFIMGIATLRSPYFGQSLVELGGFVSLAAIYLITTQVYRTVDDLRWLLLTICAAVSVSSVYAFFQGMGLDFFPWEDKTSDVYTNLPGTFGNPNYAAHTLILTMLMALYLALTWRPEALLFLIIFATHLSFTQQRAGLIALAAAAGLLLVGMLVHRVVKKPVTSALVAIVLTGVLGVVALGGAMLILQQRTGSAFPLDVSLLIRYQSYVSASDMILDASVLGHGPAVYGLSYAEYWTPFEQDWFAQEGRMNAHVHNDLMELAIDGGLPAAGLYLAMLVLGMAWGLTLAFTPGPRARRLLGYFFATFFVAYAVDGLFGFNLRVPVSAAIFFLVMGLLDGIWSRETVKSPRVIRGIACLGFLVVLGFTVLESRVFAASYQWNQGRQAEASRQYEAAQRHYEAGEALTPWDWNFKRRMGHLSIKKQDFAQAESQFLESLTLNPDYFLTRLPLANAQIMLAQQTLKEDPLALDRALDRLDDARENVEAVLDICPVYAAAENVLGRIAAVRAVYHRVHPDDTVKAKETEDWKAAEKHYLRAIDLGAPNAATLYRMVAEVRKAIADYEGAEEMYVRAAQTDPKDSSVWSPFLELATKHGRHDRLRNTLYDQIEALNQAEQTDSAAMATLHLMLANVIENGSGDIEAAERAYLAAVEFGANRPELWTNFARFAEAHGRGDALAQSIRRAVAVAEQAESEALPQVRAAHAVIQVDGVAALDGASLLLVSAVRGHDPASAITAEQAFGWAARLLNRKLVEAPEETACLAHLNLGIVFASIGQFAQAEELFRRADTCVDASQRPFLVVHRANGLIEMEREIEGVSMLRRAVAETPENFDLRMAFARALAKTGFREEAREQYDALLEQPELSAPGREMIEREMGLL